MSLISTPPTSSMSPFAPPASRLPSTSSPPALTSASRRKRKASHGALATPSGKHPRPPSAIIKAQQEDSTAMILIASAVQEMSKHLMVPTPPPMALVPPAAAPPSDFGRAIEVLSSATDISNEDKLDMVSLFLKDKDEAIAYPYINNQLKTAWVQKRLDKLHVNMCTA